MRQKIPCLVATAAIAALFLAPATRSEDSDVHRLALPDGVSIAYTVEGSGAPLVFLHGWSCDRTYWREQLPVFDGDHTVVAVDLAGHGESSADRTTWTLEQLGADVAALVRELDLEPAILIGHSMGGPVALEAARRLGPEVAGVVLVDTMHDVEQRIDPAMLENILASYRKDFGATCRQFVPTMFIPGTNPELVASVTADMCAAPPEVALALFSSFGEYDQPAAIRAVEAPIRAINAGWMPTAVDVNRKHSPGFDAIVLDGVGHFLQFEDPARFNAALSRTLADLRASDAKPRAGAAANGRQIVETRLGRVEGAVDGGVHVFKGLRYGAPPVGELRFKPPQAPAPWTSIVDATKFGAPAIQMATGNSANPSTELSKQLATIFTTSTEMKIASEDCLFLNVWTPGLGAGKRPVMVWLHGGGFAYGSGSWPVYDGRNLAKKGDVVVVTVNHRLNVFGYLHLADLAGEAYARSGNAGMLDLVAALEWVRDNIASFGGDPSNVTIFGESGGGAKVSTLMAMPSARGLFHKAIVESGPGLRAVSADDATKMAKAILDELAIAPGDAAALAKAPTEQVLAAAHAVAARVGGAFGGSSRLAPVVDGTVLPRHPFEPDAPAQSADIPVLIGWTKDEMTLFNASEPWFGTLSEADLEKRVAEIAGGDQKGAALLAALRQQRPGYSPSYLLSGAITASRMFIGSVLLAERKAAQNAAPVYVYELVWETPIGDGVFKSPHTLEIPFVFANADRAAVLVGTGPEPKILERQMSDAWLAFARSGDPNAPGLPQWPRYDAERRATMVFDVTSRVVDDPDRAIREALEN
jgi:para-nitrobenzyl esterase